MHIPKCAGTTIEAWLADSCPDATYKEDTVAGIPFRLREANFAKIIGLHSDYYTFTFVRSPYSRFLSIWNHSNRAEAGSEYYFQRDPIDSPEDFAAILLRGEHERLSRFDRFHTKPQCLYLPTEGEIFSIPVPKKYDLIGRVEQFNHDLERLRHTIQNPGMPRENFRVSGIDWRQQMNASLYAMISELYEQDIKVLAELFPDEYGSESESWSNYRLFHRLP